MGATNVSVSAGIPGARGLQGPISGNLASASSVTALRSVVADSSGNAYLLGYYTANDGGGGLFVWNSASTAIDDGGTIIQPTYVSGSNPGRWLRVYDGALNALWFGLKNDGVTPNDAANTAMIASVAAQLGKNVFYP